jgi:hypothetical protein
MSGQKITLRKKAAYGCGDFASSMFWELFFIFNVPGHPDQGHCGGCISLFFKPDGTLMAKIDTELKQVRANS